MFYIDFGNEKQTKIKLLSEIMNYSQLIRVVADYRASRTTIVTAMLQKKKMSI